MAIASFIAGETISAGDAVYVGANNLIYKAIATNLTQSSVVGVAIDSGQSGALLKINTDALYFSYSGLTAGNTLYLSIANSGQLVSYSTFSSQLASSSLSGAYLESVGRAVSSSGIEIEVGKPVYIIK